MFGLGRRRAALVADRPAEQPRPGRRGAMPIRRASSGHVQERRRAARRGSATLARIRYARAGSAVLGSIGGERRGDDVREPLSPSKNRDRLRIEPRWPPA